MKSGREISEANELHLCYTFRKDGSDHACGRWRLGTRIALCWGNLQYPHMLKESIPSVCTWSSGGYFRESYGFCMRIKSAPRSSTLFVGDRAKDGLKDYEGFQYQVAKTSVCLSKEWPHMSACWKEPRGSPVLLIFLCLILITSDLRSWQQDLMGQTRWALPAKANMQPSILQFIRLPSWELMEVVC